MHITEETTLTKEELAAKVWGILNKLRTKIKAAEYKDYILGFIFYKFLSDEEEVFLASIGSSKEDLKDINGAAIDYIKTSKGYYIAYDNLYSVWADNNSLLASDVSKALQDFNNNIDEAYKDVFNNIFSVLQNGLTKLGDTSGARDKACRDIIDSITEIPATSDHYDVLGYIYEYIIGQFATTAKEDGAFYTPHEVSNVIAKIIANHLKDRNKVAIYDPTCGSASLLMQVGEEVSRYVDKNNIEYFGQELINDTYNLSRMNLTMKGVPAPNILIRNGDTLEDDWPYFDEVTAYKPVYVDACISNPPYSLKWEPDRHDTDARFKDYGLAPSSKADYAFLLHCLYHLKSDGMMGIVLPHGVLFRGGSEGVIRQKLLENHQIETIIGLPGNLFFNTSIPTIIMFLKKNRTKSDVLFIDASSEFKKEKKQNVLQPENIEKIIKAVEDRKDIDKFAHLATFDEIKENDYNLNIPRYVNTFEEEEEIDLDEVRAELDKINSDEKKCLAEINSMMAELGLAGI